MLDFYNSVFTKLIWDTKRYKQQNVKQNNSYDEVQNLTDIEYQVKKVFKSK